MFHAAFVGFMSDEAEVFGTFESFEEAVSEAWNTMVENCPESEGYEIREASPWGCKWNVFYGYDEIGTYGVIEDEEDEF